MIGARDLHKRFGTVTALDGVTFVAAGGSVTGLLGPNGAGKTTTLRILSGVIRPDRGVAAVDDEDVAVAPLRAKARLGVLPDGAGLYGRLTARDHLEYSGRLHGLRGRTLAGAIARAVAAFDLRALADRPVHGFSQGERKQLGLARAVVHDPPNLILDEPTAGLDVPAARRLRRAVRELAEAGTCVLVSTHIMQEVSAMCDRIVVIARGRVIAEGTPEEVIRAGGGGDLEQAFVRLIGSDEGLR
jgi:sodium transport system ATP-binding protein